MIVYPNAKINIGLHILEKYPNGFHRIESILYPVDMCDILEIIPSDKFRFGMSGIPVDGTPDTNLVVRAFRMMEKQYGIPPVSIHLHKMIPPGSGLGGGSSDAAHTLKALNSLFDKNIPEEVLEDLAMQLGSDCPFFIRNRPVLASGKGNEFSPVSLDLSGYGIKIVTPEFSINTGWAYSQVIPSEKETSLADLIRLPVPQWQGKITNDFEKALFPHYPELARLKRQLLQEGAVYASLTGSGSAVYGLFRRKNN